MINKNLSAKNRNVSADQSKASRSSAEQIDSAENEGMPALPQRVSAQSHNDHEPSESTTLERRVLAHERILKSLIAHMAETEPRFLERLQKTYGIQIKNREQNYTETEDFAEEFVRAIEEAVLDQSNSGKSGTNTANEKSETERIETNGSKKKSPRRFQIKNRNGIWQVNENGNFYGDYIHKEQAQEAVRVGILNRKVSR